MSYIYDPQRGYVTWNQPQTSTVTVQGQSPIVSATNLNTNGWTALGNNMVSNPAYGAYAYNPLQSSTINTTTNSALGIGSGIGSNFNSGLQNQMQQANQLAMLQENRPDFWSLEGAFGSKTGNYAGWANSAISGLTALGNMYFGYQGMKLAKKELEERTALQRANYRNTARAMNTAYRDQASGRGYNGMNQEAKSALGQQYANRKVSETY